LLESALIADLLRLHLRLNIVGEGPVSAGGVIEAGGFDVHFAAAAACKLLFQNSRKPYSLSTTESAESATDGSEPDFMLCAAISPSAEGGWQNTFCVLGQGQACGQ